MEVKATESLRITWARCARGEDGLLAVGVELYNEAGVLATRARLPFLSGDVDSVPIEFSCDPPEAAEITLVAGGDDQTGFIPLATAKAGFTLRIAAKDTANHATSKFRLRASTTLAPSTLRVMPALSPQLPLGPAAPADEGESQSSSAVPSIREVVCTIDEQQNRLLVVEQPSLVGFFGVLWDSALVLSNYLLNHTALVRSSQNIVELGACTGVCSMLAKRIHPEARIVATDLDDIIPLLRRNLPENGFADDDVAVMEYAWGTDVFEDSTHRDNTAEPSTPEQVVHDGHLRRQCFDLVIASDVIFDPAYWDDLWRSFDDLLTTRRNAGNDDAGPQVVLVNRIRNPLEAEFFNHPASSTWNRVRVETALDAAPLVEVGGGIRFEDTVIDILTRRP